jgi:hypothetical protein
VNGYGCDLDTPLAPYLQRVARFIRENGVHNAVFCGGATQRRTFHGRTEARVMSAYIVAALPADYPLRVHHEESSYTTYRNARNAAGILRYLQGELWEGGLPRPGELTVFCEAQRVFKVMLCYWLLLPEYRPCTDGLRVRFETDSWEKANPFTEILKLGNELAMHALPPFEKYMHAKREALSERR